MLRRLITFSALVLVAGEPAAPLVPVLLACVRDPANTGRSFSASARLVGRDVVSVSVEITVTGVGMLLPFETMRDPVTTMSEALAAAAAAVLPAAPGVAGAVVPASVAAPVGAAACWACAVPAIANRLVVATKAAQKCLDMIPP